MYTYVCLIAQILLSCCATLVAAFAQTQALVASHATKTPSCAKVLRPAMVKLLSAHSLCSRRGLQVTGQVEAGPSLSEGLPLNLLQHVDNEVKQRGLDSDLVMLLASLQSACKSIAGLVRRAGIIQMTGPAGGGAENAGGDKQKKLDVAANDLLKAHLAQSGRVRVLASEEEDEPVLVTESGRYVVVFDPLDGSSNIDASIPTGTIFGVYKALKGGSSLKANVLQRGGCLVAGGYCLYASTTVLVMSLGAGTHHYTLDRELGDFILTRPNFRMPSRGRTYSLNEARESDWPEGLRRYIHDMKTGSNRSGEQYDLSYICSLVADVHWSMFYGGVAMNPRSHLRLVYEGNPMGFVVQQAGGKASTGGAPMLEVQPTSIHQRIPTFLGSAEDIVELESYGDVQQLGDKKYDV